MHLMSDPVAVAPHLTPEQIVEREHLYGVRSVRRASVRATRARLAADLVRLGRWERGGELWTSSSEQLA